MRWLNSVAVWLSRASGYKAAAVTAFAIGTWVLTKYRLHSELGVYGVLAVYLVVLGALGWAWYSRRDAVDGFLFSARYRLLPITFPYLNEDLQDGPNRYHWWDDRPAIVTLKMSVSRRVGLPGCLMTLKNAGTTHRNLLFKGMLGVNVLSNTPSKTSDVFEPKWNLGDIGRRLDRTYFVLVNLALPVKGQRIGWVITPDGDTGQSITGDCALRRESLITRLRNALGAETLTP